MEVELTVQECYSPADSQQKDNSSQQTENLTVSISEQSWQDWFHQWLDLLYPAGMLNAAAHHPPRYEMTLRLTDDLEIQALNAQYRQIEKPTDVLAFAALEVEGPPSIPSEDSLPLYLGDIVVSVDTAKRQAQEQGHSLREELAWLSAHGLLHLLGWDHPDDESLEQMLEQQAALLHSVGVTTERESG
ncbi:MAG: rRNA maturation RNase YbeY [Leptolyngbyaceae cyanobacterium bins.59]|nr:rRNA maturation RNase YbeY [Leptolyngbyaceae cyanobacterium bins.59]